MRRIASLVMLVGSPAGLAAQNPGNLEQILQVAGAYVQQYERDLSAVTAQEDYQQVVPPTPGSRALTSSRKTRAYLLVLDLGQLGWVTFRDVFEVDGRPVREREERLSRLLAHITPDSLEQARRIAAESARFNLDASGVRIDRTINTPMTALLFLRPANQPRSAFRLGRIEQIDGVTCVALSFTERAKPRLVRSNDEAAAQGTFWIDITAGRVMRSELRLESTRGRGFSVGSQIVVKYARVAALDLWVPFTMDEVYELFPSRQIIKGHAEYTDFRRFTVTTTEGLK